MNPITSEDIPNASYPDLRVPGDSRPASDIGNFAATTSPDDTFPAEFTGLILPGGMIGSTVYAPSSGTVTPQGISPHRGRSNTVPIRHAFHVGSVPPAPMTSRLVEDPYSGASTRSIPGRFHRDDDTFLTSFEKDESPLPPSQPLQGPVVAAGSSTRLEDCLKELSSLRIDTPVISPVPSVPSASDSGLSSSPAVSIPSEESRLPRQMRFGGGETRFDSPAPTVISIPDSTINSFNGRLNPRLHENLSPITERTELNSAPETPATYRRLSRPLPRSLSPSEPQTQHALSGQPSGSPQGIFTFVPFSPTGSGHHPPNFQYTPSTNSNTSTFHPFTTLVLPPTQPQPYQSIGLAAQQLQLRQILTGQSPTFPFHPGYATNAQPSVPNMESSTEPVIPGNVAGQASGLASQTSPLSSAFPSMAQLPMSPLTSIPLRAGEPIGSPAGSVPSPSVPYHYPPGFMSYPSYPAPNNHLPGIVPGGQLPYNPGYMPFASTFVPPTNVAGMPASRAPRRTPQTALDIPRGRFYFEDGNIIFSVKNERVYRVHKYFFQKSPVLASQIQSYRPMTPILEEYPPILLDDVSPQDFELVLAILYPDEMEIESLHDWSNALRTAKRYQIQCARMRAAEEIVRNASPVEMIVVCTDYTDRIPVQPFIYAFLDLLCSNESLSKEEMELLGPKYSLVLGEMQSELACDMKKYLDADKVKAMIRRKLRLHELISDDSDGASSVD
ncbi:hypothetical protein VKT23_000413 [Stygiomarasmius scandens]|uniref:BTB domain-containing protein n=1 Tax=Marasmiellus scandens TaxID=2682957 RepID=A0ABR1K9F0_9AGAR